jgi:hypothetical protein
MEHRRRRPLTSFVLAGLLSSACGGRSGSPAGPSGPAPGAPIGAAGGTVTGAAAQLVVPANALSAPVALTIRATTSVPLDPYAVFGGSIEVGPAGTTFAMPATLVLRYTSGQPPLGIDERELALHMLDGGEWRRLPAGAVDPAAREVSAPIGAAGVFAARWVVGPSVVCSGAEARQFDFWLGSWNLVSAGALQGTNDIVRNGCVLEEEFRSAGGGIGRSVSFFSGADRHWYQTYVDSQGNRLPLRGMLEAADMVLYQDTGNTRSTWQPQGRDRVRFFQEAMSGASWRITFDSVYVPR